MTRRELALLNTARSTNLCLDKHRDAWSHIPGFAEQREAIRTKVEELESLAGEGAVDRTGFGLQAQRALEALAEEAWIVAGQVQAWAAVHGDEELRKASIAARDEFISLQLEAPERALQIHQMAAGCLERGGESFGLSRDRLDRLAEQIQAVKVLRTASRRTAQADGEESDLEGGLGQVMDLLCEVADPLMRRFRREEPGFFEDYQAARRIIDPATGEVLRSDEELADLAAEETAFAAGTRPVRPGAAERKPERQAALSS